MANHKDIIRLQNIVTGEYGLLPEKAASHLTQPQQPVISLEKGTIIAEVYTIEEKLNFLGGESLHYVCNNDGKKFVLKIYHDHISGSEDVLSRLVGQKHPHILTPVAYGKYDGYFYEINPLMKKGTLFDHLDSINQSFIIRTLIPQLNEAIHFLHNLGILHNDIKPSNLYLSDDEKHILLGDFGAAETLMNHKTFSTKVAMKKRYSPGYAPLERINRQLISISSDYFSFGKTILSLVDPSHFKGLNERDKIDDQFIGDGLKISNIGIAGEKIDENLKDLIAKLCLEEPAKRITNTGVSNWLLNPKYYFHAYQNRALPDRYPIAEIEFAGQTFDDFNQLLQSLKQSPSISAKFLSKHGLLSLFKEANKKLFDDYESYLIHFRDRPQELLTLCHQILNPPKEIELFNQSFQKLQELFQYMAIHYPKLTLSDLSFYQIIFFLRQSNPAPYFINLIEECIALPNNASRLDALLSIFASENKRIRLFFKGVQYLSLEAFFKAQFGTNLDVLPIAEEDYRLLIFILGNLSEDIKHYEKKLLSIKDHEERMYELSERCCQKIFLKFKDKELPSLTMMFNWLGHALSEKPARPDIPNGIIRYFFSPSFSLYLDIHKPIKAPESLKLKNLIKVLELKKDLTYAKAYLWFSFNKEAPLYFEGKAFKDYQAIINYAADLSPTDAPATLTLRLKKIEQSPEIKAFKETKGIL